MTQEKEPQGTSFPSSPTTPKKVVSENAQLNGGQLRQRKKLLAKITIPTDSPVSSSPQTPSTPPVKRKSSEVDGLYGYTSDDIRFKVPNTFDCIDVLLMVKKWIEFPVMIEIGLMAAYTFLFFYGAPKWFFLINFVIWRLCYNLGLGLILRHQSKSKAFTRWFTNWVKGKEAWFERNISTKENVLNHTVYRLKDYPDDFNAWMAFRAIVDIVLGCDLCCYLLFTLSYFEAPEKIGILEILQYLLGALLCIFNFWAKSDAHRVIGDYAWYWGDFFFLLDKKLVFNGIFQMFPHPMYTVGYSFYYGLSMLTRSYTVFYISFFAHMLQLTFLTLVENPHIEKTYGKMTNIDPETQKKLVEEGYLSKTDMWFVLHFDIFRSSDFFFIVIMVYTVVLTMMPVPMWFRIVHLLIWRLFHNGVLGAILYFQSKNQWWTNRVIRKGGTKQQAFDSWKRVYNLSLTINHTLFLFCSLRMYTWPSGFNDLGRFFLSQLIGVILIMLNVWSASSTHEVLGDFGWYYGDFFIDEVPKKLFYNGVYRYFNNPELVLGFAAYYGLSIMSRSYTMFFLALLSHGATYLFNILVEKPHMEKEYGKDNLRKRGGLHQEVQEGINKVKPKLLKLKDELSTKVDEFKLDLEKLQQQISSAEGRERLAKELKSLGSSMMEKLKAKIKN